MAVDGGGVAAAVDGAGWDGATGAAGAAFFLGPRAWSGVAAWGGLAGFAGLGFCTAPTALGASARNSFATCPGGVFVVSGFFAAAASGAIETATATAQSVAMPAVSRRTSMGGAFRARPRPRYRPLGRDRRAGRAATTTNVQGQPASARPP